jgi:hypothetical protein
MTVPEIYLALISDNRPSISFCELLIQRIITKDA